MVNRQLTRGRWGSGVGQTLCENWTDIIPNLADTLLFLNNELSSTKEANFVSLFQT